MKGAEQAVYTDDNIAQPILRRIENEREARGRERGEEQLDAKSLKFPIRFRRGFRLPQRSHLRTLKYFVSENRGNVVKNRGNIE